MKRAWMIAAVIGAVVLPSEGASAKSEGLLTRQYVIGGEQAGGNITFLSRHRWELRDWTDGGPFFAYISPARGNPGRPVPPLPEGARLVAPVSIGPIQRVEGTKRLKYIEISADFRMPDLRPNKYRIDVCTDPCTATIDHTYPDVFRIVAGPTERRIQRRLDRAFVEASHRGYLAGVAVKRVKQRRLEIEELSGDVYEDFADLDAQIEAMKDQLKAARRAAADRPFPLTVAGVGVAGGAVMVGTWWLLRARKSGTNRSLRNSLR